MSFLSKNVIPGNHGKVFGTNATSHQDLIIIQTAVQKIKGVKDAIIKEDVFPREITIHTEAVVSVKEIEDVVIAVGFHAIPKSIFPL